MTAANEAAFLVAFAYIAVILAVFWLGAVAARWLAGATRGWFGESADHDPHAELHCLDDDLAAEWEMRYRAQAPRRRGQELPPVAGIGDRSLDEIRRDFTRSTNPNRQDIA